LVSAPAVGEMRLSVIEAMKEGGYAGEPLKPEYGETLLLVVSSLPKHVFRKAVSQQDKEREAASEGREGTMSVRQEV